MDTTQERDRARAIAVALEAENATLRQAAAAVIADYIGAGLCPDTACDCTLTQLTRLLEQDP